MWTDFWIAFACACLLGILIALVFFLRQGDKEIRMAEAEMYTKSVLFDALIDATGTKSMEFTVDGIPKKDTIYLGGYQPVQTGKKPNPPKTGSNAIKPTQMPKRPKNNEKGLKA